MIKWILLASDAAFFAVLLGLVVYVRYVHRHAPLLAQWRRVFEKPQAMVCAVVLAFLMLIAMVDSLHYREQIVTPTLSNASAPVYSPSTVSMLDNVLSHLKSGQEKTYSRPFDSIQLIKETTLLQDAVDLKERSVRDNPPLKFGGTHLRQVGQRGPVADRLFWQDIVSRTAHGALLGAVIATVLVGVWLAILLANRCLGFNQVSQLFERSSSTYLPWAAAFKTLAVVCVVMGALLCLSGAWHPLGSDRAGNDLLYIALKSVRTALIIGILTTLASLPFALVLGVVAGTLRGRVDSAVQYVYTVLSSIPGVLLIVPCVLMLQGYVDNHLDRYPTALERADIKLFGLCIVLGLTSWAGLARLLRAEAMKLREMDFVLAARSFGVPHWKIMCAHIVPNTLHLLILTVVMDFSGLVLYEAVLSYIGMGVDPAIQSLGGIINGARSELARNPIIAWPLFSAFSVMLLIVLSANVFADAVRDAFDPKSAVVKQ
jgi:peptide/nickel transport system permease protein